MIKFACIAHSAWSTCFHPYPRYSVDQVADFDRFFGALPGCLHKAHVLESIMTCRHVRQAIYPSASGRIGSPAKPSTDKTSIWSFGLVRLTDSTMSSSGVIAAVHGLNSDAYTTWTCINATCWLKEDLSTFSTLCMVYTYGYPPKIFTNSCGEAQSHRH